MKILVTGGAGFIGINFLLNMVEKYKEDTFVCLDKLTYASNKKALNPIIKNRNFKFVKGDISNKRKVDELFDLEKFDVVINFAAESHVDNSIKNPGVFLKTNIIGTGVLLNASVKHGVKRFHQVSTDEVYGDLPLDRPDLLFSEDSPLNPSSPYSASKTAADLLALSYHRTFNLPVTISRCSNNYGPYQNKEKLIPLMISRAINDESLPVYGDGLNVRDWIYVDDHCNAIDFIVRNGEIGQIYNVGGNSEKTNIEIVNIILDSLNKPKTLIKYVKDRAGHDRRYAINDQKIVKCGFKKNYNFDSAIVKTIDFYLDSKKCYEKNNKKNI